MNASPSSVAKQFRAVRYGWKTFGMSRTDHNPSRPFVTTAAELAGVAERRIAGTAVRSAFVDACERIYHPLRLVDAALDFVQNELPNVRRRIRHLNRRFAIFHLGRRESRSCAVNLRVVLPHHAPIVVIRVR